ncbi:unnamed protein product [Arctogadus glacialis]
MPCVENQKRSRRSSAAPLVLMTAASRPAAALAHGGAGGGVRGGNRGLRSPGLPRALLAPTGPQIRPPRGARREGLVQPLHWMTSGV